MPAIYTEDWYKSVQATLNEYVGRLKPKDVPKGTWHAVVEIVGDGVSPYVSADAIRRFLIRIDNGTCAWYREIDVATPDDVELDYRFTGSAAVFDGVAAGQRDPVDAALEGTIKVRGDMRFLMRQAELVKAFLDAYTQAVDTEWPQGAPPYATNGSAGN